MRAALVLVAAVAFAGGGTGAQAQGLGPVQRLYVEHCGGCHGLQGTVAPAKVPDLKDRAGYFQCTPAARDYLVQLPNVALASLNDAELTQVVNFVAFDLGGKGAPARAPRFTPPEVARLRKAPLISASLESRRAELVAQIEKACAAPVALRNFN